jgi:hypothetical protein
LLLGLAEFSLLLRVIQGLLVDPLRFEGWSAQWLVGVARSPSRRARYALTLQYKKKWLVAISPYLVCAVMLETIALLQRAVQQESHNCKDLPSMGLIALHA